MMRDKIRLDTPKCYLKLIFFEDFLYVEIYHVQTKILDKFKDVIRHAQIFPKSIKIMVKEKKCHTIFEQDLMLVFYN